MVELCSERYSTFAGTANFVGDSAAILYLTFYYRYISKSSYAIFWFALFLNVITFVATFFIPESPKWLISQKQYE
jgi:hypothetical protein